MLDCRDTGRCLANSLSQGSQNRDAGPNWRATCCHSSAIRMQYSTLFCDYRSAPALELEERPSKSSQPELLAPYRVRGHAAAFIYQLRCLRTCGRFISKSELHKVIEIKLRQQAGKCQRGRIPEVPALLVVGSPVRANRPTRKISNRHCCVAARAPTLDRYGGGRLVYP